MKSALLILIMTAALTGCDNSAAPRERNKEVAAAEAEVKATSAYALVVAESGKEVDPSDPRVKQTALILFDASKHFNATEKEVANIAYYHAQKLRGQGVAVSATDLMIASMKASPAGVGSNIQTLNAYGATYQK